MRLGYYEPFSHLQVISFIGKTLLDNNQQSFVEEYGLYPFEIRVLQPKRTLCEKIMSLVRFSYDREPIFALRNKIRHLYYIHQILKNEEFAEFFYSSEFEVILNKVANDDVSSLRNNINWIRYHPKDEMIFSDEQIWGKLNTTYLNDFSKLIYGDLPTVEDMLKTLVTLRKRVNNIKWEVEDI